ncbi:mechanosensitive ion channel [Candidatus Woesearchaeota archaeon]|nr:mechanosensitive ion channel [Candidatus Woesearchaeota archaeon]
MADSIISAIYDPNTILPPFFTRSVVAIIILLMGFVLGRIIGKITQKVLREIELNRIIKKATGMKIALEEIVAKLLTYFIYFIFMIWALNELGLTTTILTMISGAALVIIILSILLAIKDFIPNAFAGFVIHRKRQIKPGDRIKTDGLQGKIARISLVETEIKTKKGDTIYIPNSILTKREIIVHKRKSK